MLRSRCALAALLIAGMACVSAPAASAEPASPEDGGTAPAASPMKATRINDIDGDGRLDLVFVDRGTEQEDEGPSRPGSVQVLFGNGKVQHVTYAELGRPKSNESELGQGLVVGDLNQDGYADVVVSDPNADPGSSGAVWAIWGSPTGISASRTTVLIRGRDLDAVGGSIAFIPLPEPVLAISSAVNSTGPPGYVDLYRVTRDGRLGAHRRVAIGSPGIAGAAPPDAGFGWSLAASGDLLVIGAPGAGPVQDAGAAYILQLLPGLKYWATRVLQGSKGVPGTPEKSDGMGTSVSVLNDRVAIGVPYERLRGHEFAGAIQLLRVERTTRGLRVHPGRLVTQASAGVPGELGTNHFLGAEVLVTRLCGRGYGVLTGESGTDRVLSVPFSPGPCSGGWVSPQDATTGIDPARAVWPPFSIFRDVPSGSDKDRPVIAVGRSTVTIGWPGEVTTTNLTGRTTAELRRLAPPAA